jgi:hypothetical protein
MLAGRTGGSRRVTTSTPLSTRGTGLNWFAGIRGPKRCSHHGAQATETRVSGGQALSGHLVLDDEVRSPKRRGRIVEQVMEDLGGYAVRDRPDHPEGFGAREPDREEVRFDHLECSLSQPAQVTGPHRVHLDRDDPGTRLYKGAGDGSLAGADLDDEVARLDGGVFDELLSASLKKKVLTETAASDVSDRTPARAHGASPSLPCRKQ